ncbi:hypothetical protein [Nocardioides astragali]|uniref:Lipoprotein n=1 Tax=Nocardioides astragali TaxID=1776736 RepID=A0ABW2N4N1_9ACTN|nr:hypothetical protein [Nocardioides astragali]
MSKTRLMTAATLGVAGLMLSGCGSATPGVAVKVGDDEFSTGRVDEAAAHLCTALRDDFDTGEVYSMSFVRQRVVGLLTMRSQSEQIAEEYDVEPGSVYGQAVAQAEQVATSKPEELRSDYVELSTAFALKQDVRDQVGRLELEENGVAEPTVEQVSQAGEDVFKVWLDANAFEIDPRFGLKNVDGVLTPVDTNVSVAVSDEAKAAVEAGLAIEPDPAFAETLPPTHRCG